VLNWDEVDQDSWDIRTLPSEPAVFTTCPSVPSQAPPPTLVSRERKVLKVCVCVCVYSCVCVPVCVRVWCVCV